MTARVAGQRLDYAQEATVRKRRKTTTWCGRHFDSCIVPLSSSSLWTQHHCLFEANNSNSNSNSIKVWAINHSMEEEVEEEETSPPAAPCHPCWVSWIQRKSLTTINGRWTKKTRSFSSRFFFFKKKTLGRAREHFSLSFIILTDAICNRTWQFYP